MGRYSDTQDNAPEGDVSLPLSKDPTERRVQKPIPRYERMLRRAEQLAGMGSWHLDVDTNTVIWSDELYRIYGLDPGTPLSYETFIERVHSDDRVRVRAVVATALEERRPFRLQERIVRPDGQVRMLDTQGEVEVDERGRPISLFGFCRDVTERTQARQALEDREQQFAKMFHASPVATTLTTLADGRFLDANTRFLELTGYRREELIGHTSQALGLWDRTDEHDRVLAKLREAGSLREIQVRYRHRGGQEGRVLASLERIEIGGEDCLLTLLWRA
jgi:PAS domain S-box-containing protein